MPEDIKCTQNDRILDSYIRMLQQHYNNNNSISNKKQLSFIITLIALKT